MRTERQAKRVTIFVGETDRYQGRPLFEALVAMLHSHGIAGAVATRGVMGYGASGRTHAAHLLDIAEDLPVTVVFVDTADKIEAVMPAVDEMIESGLATVEDVVAITYSRS
jgi:PII-like signaling protein